MSIQPLRNSVFIEYEEPKSETKSGIILETQQIERPIEGVVKFAGPKCQSVKVGDRVMFKKYGPDEIEVGEEKYLVCEEEDIIAIMQ